MTILEVMTLDMTSAKSILIMGVDYRHVVLPTGDDLYITPFGLPLREHLTPDNYFTDQEWQSENRRPLSGTSSVYYARTKPIAGQSRELVLKWNRMGQDIPGGTGDIDFDNAEFNTPFEEFSLVYELRTTRHESRGMLYTQKPLAIYVPNEKVDLDLLGRHAYRIKNKQKRHGQIQLHPERRYAVIYQWIRGIDAYQAWREGWINEFELHTLANTVSATMDRRGFAVADHKATHIIVRPRQDGTVRRDRTGNILYAYVDFELLRRTTERESFIRNRSRQDYLTAQAKRFSVRKKIPQHLHRVNIMGVDYIHRPIQSTGGALWVVGRDPDLFEFFLPEKWRRTPRIRLSSHGQTYHTCTKDNVNLVWRVSRVGELPDRDPFRSEERRILDAGYNSPFEEFSLSQSLTTKGIPTTYPRAIYMTGSKTEIRSSLRDERTYQRHAELRTPEGLPILQSDRDYILLWGFWNGPDETLAVKDEDHWKAINALHAMREGLLDKATYFQLMQTVQSRLNQIGVEDLSLRGSHILLSQTGDGSLIRGEDGKLAYRICSFDLLSTASLQ